MRLRIRLIFALAAWMLSSVGCGARFDIYAPDQIHRTVQSRGKGLYVVYYEWPYMENHFGKNRALAVPEYLREKGLVPPECKWGTTVVRGGDAEGGKGWAEFRCTEKENTEKLRRK